MTLAELQRAIESKKRVKEVEAQEKAIFDYILADLIGKSVARVYNSSNKMPELVNAYPSLFNTEEYQKSIEAKKAEVSALRFKQFVEAHNKKYKGGK